MTDTTQTPTPPATPRPPMSPEQLVDLRRRVLAKEPVSDDELRHALETTANVRGTGPAPKAAKVDTSYQPQGSLAERFANFKKST